MVIFLLILLLLIFSFFSIAPYVPTKSSDLERINEIINKKPWKSFYEIWCWDAKVCHFIAKNNPEKEVVWIEFSPLFYFISKLRSIFFPLKNLKIIYGNALNEDFSKYDVFYVFWLENPLKYKLKPKFEKEMKDQARVISYVFDIKDWNWKEEVYKESLYVLSVYVYEKD